MGVFSNLRGPYVNKFEHKINSCTYFLFCVSYLQFVNIFSEFVNMFLDIWNIFTLSHSTRGLFGKSFIQDQPLILWSWNLLLQFILLNTPQQHWDTLQYLCFQKPASQIFCPGTLLQPQQLMWAGWNLFAVIYTIEYSLAIQTRLKYLSFQSPHLENFSLMILTL